VSTPRGLKSAGRRLWRSVQAEYELSGVEEDRLLRAAQLADMRETLRREAGDNVRAVAEVRKLSLDIDKLGGITESAEAPSRTQTAQRMASLRWSKEARLGR
jgi:hypothetical protein